MDTSASPPPSTPAWLPAPPEQSSVEQTLVESRPGAVLLEIHVLRPTPEVRAAGRRVRLPRIESLLLLLLSVDHPAPMHVETLHESLWPEQPLNRPRLNALVYRTRSDLGPAAAALRRGRDMVGLDPGLTRTDLAAYRRALAGAPEARARAVVAVAGNLGNVAHPYEDRLIDARERFLEEWLVQVGDLLRTGALDPHQLAPALAALGLHPRAVTG